MFIRDEITHIINHNVYNNSFITEVRHELYDSEFGEVISIYAPNPQWDWTEQYIDRFIRIYESKGLPVAPNLIKYMMQELLCDKGEYVNYVVEKYPQYAGEMRKWLVLL